MPEQNSPFSNPYKAPETPSFDTPVDASEIDTSTTDMTDASYRATEPTQQMPAASQPEEWSVHEAAASVAEAAKNTFNADQTYTQPSLEYANNTGYDQAGYYNQPATPFSEAATPPPSPYGSQPGTYTGKGTPALVLGILSIVFAGLVGLVLGIIAIVKGGSALKFDPTDGRAKAGRITGIIGTILSVLLLILSIVFFVSLGAAMNDPDVQEAIQELEDSYDLNGSYNLEYDFGDEQGSISGTLGSNTAGSTATSGSESTNTGEEDAVKAVVTEQMDKVVKMSEEDRAAALEEIESGFTGGTGFLFDEIGISKDEYVNWVLEGMEYSVGRVRVDGNYAEAQVSVTARDLAAFSKTVEERVDGMSSEDMAKISSLEDFYANIGNMLKEVMGQTGTTTTDITLHLTKNGDKWEIEPYSLDEIGWDLYGYEAYYDI